MDKKDIEEFLTHLAMNKKWNFKILVSGEISEPDEENKLLSKNSYKPKNKEAQMARIKVDRLN